MEMAGLGGSLLDPASELPGPGGNHVAGVSRVVWKWQKEEGSEGGRGGHPEASPFMPGRGHPATSVPGYCGLSSMCGCCAGCSHRHGPRPRSVSGSKPPSQRETPEMGRAASTSPATHGGGCRPTHGDHLRRCSGPRNPPETQSAGVWMPEYVCACVHARARAYVKPIREDGLPLSHLCVGSWGCRPCGPGR